MPRVVMMQQPMLPMHVQRSEKPYRGLEVTIIILGAFGFLFWGAVIGFTLGYCLYAPQTVYGIFVLIPVNAAYIYYVSRIIFSVSAPSFPNPRLLRDVRKINSRLVSAIIIGFSVFVTATVWFIIDRPSYGDARDSFTTFFSGSFSFIWTVAVVVLTGVHETKCSELLAVNGINAPATVVTTERPPSGHQNPSSYYELYPRQQSGTPLGRTSIGHINTLSSSHRDLP
ncbi:hypothetical protein SK128_027295 [Halocaridina rubra]|uniref:Uncharacterized protein n=1 Tax=Halocaridina rubra TaxID=373956 RepID=A0AAN8WLM2_HALRR